MGDLIFITSVLSARVGELKLSHSPHGRESGFRNPGKFCFWNPESSVGIQDPWLGIRIQDFL